MTNEELKKKIISVLQSVEFVTEKGWCGQCISLRLDYSAIADALIAAGLTFDSEYKKLYEDEKAISQSLRGTSWQFKGWYEEQKRRAEVAEKAFSNCIENFVKFQYEQKSIQLDNVFLDEVIKKCLQQAEKELAEEGKE